MHDLSPTINQNYHVNGRDLTVQLDEELGFGVVWIQRTGPLPVWYRFEIWTYQSIPHTDPSWKLDPNSSSNDNNPKGLAKLVESWLSFNRANLCNGKS